MKQVLDNGIPSLSDTGNIELVFINDTLHCSVGGDIYIGLQSPDASVPLSTVTCTDGVIDTTFGVISQLTSFGMNRFTL